MDQLHSFFFEGKIRNMRGKIKKIKKKKKWANYWIVKFLKLLKNMFKWRKLRNSEEINAQFVDLLWMGSGQCRMPGNSLKFSLIKSAAISIQFLGTVFPVKRGRCEDSKKRLFWGALGCCFLTRYWTNKIPINKTYVGSKSTPINDNDPTKFLQNIRFHFLPVWILKVSPDQVAFALSNYFTQLDFEPRDSVFEPASSFLANVPIDCHNEKIEFN